MDSFWRYNNIGFAIAFGVIGAVCLGAGLCGKVIHFGTATACALMVWLAIREIRIEEKRANTYKSTKR